MPTYNSGRVLVGTAAAAAGSIVGLVIVNFIGATSLLRFAASKAGLSKLELKTTFDEVIAVVIVVVGRSARDDDVTTDTDAGLRCRDCVTICSYLSRTSGGDE